MFRPVRVAMSALLIGACADAGTPTSPMSATSPDGDVQIAFTLQDGGVPAYTIDYLGAPVVLESRLGLEPDLVSGFSVTTGTTRVHAGEWRNELGERSIVPDHYQELSVDLQKESGLRLRITLRAYNEGAALRYTLLDVPTGTFEFSGERTEFVFPEGTFGYEEYGTEGEYRRAAIEEIEPWCERPLTVEYADGRYASLTEAANFAYPRMLLSPLPGREGALVSALGGNWTNIPDGAGGDAHKAEGELAAGEATPWRVFVVGERPGDLLERNYLVLNLNPPSTLAETGWIEPGKVMRDMDLSTETSKAIIDFATTGGVQYVLLDARWYGSEDSETGDATQGWGPVLDIEEIVRYGREKGVGLIVYVDRRQMQKQRETLFPLYEQWGLKGVKIGFIAEGSQDDSAWRTATIDAAAKHHLMLNIHDGYRPTGGSRTYPNLMTVEGIRGNEHMPTATHNCTLPFTRYIAGPGDYTVCYLEPRLKTTHAHQLAMAVVSFSPLQLLYWYDRPEEYGGEPELEFFRQMPTVWDETRVLHGAIGEYATIARRSGEEWFIGTINAGEPRRLAIPLNFLEEGRRYVAHIYADDANVATETQVGVRTREVRAGDAIEATLQPTGGQAVWIEPAEGE